MANEHRGVFGEDLRGKPRTRADQRNGAEDERNLDPGRHHVFGDEVFRPQETWARRAFRNLIYFNEVDRGGHFAAWEEPEIFAAELRAAFRSVR